MTDLRKLIEECPAGFQSLGDSIPDEILALLDERDAMKVELGRLRGFLVEDDEALEPRKDLLKRVHGAARDRDLYRRLSIQHKGERDNWALKHGELEVEIEGLKAKVTEWMATEERTRALHQALKEKIERLKAWRLCECGQRISHHLDELCGGEA